MTGKRASPGWPRSAKGCRRIQYSKSERFSSFTARTSTSPAKNLPPLLPFAPPALLVLQAHDLELLHPARSPHLDDVALGLPNEGLGDRRGVGDLAELDVRFVLADDLVGHGLLVPGVEELDRRTEHHAPIVVEQCGIDDLRVGELRFELEDAPLDEALALARGLVLGVLRDVALGARFRDRGDDRGTVLGLEAVQLGAQLLGADERDRDLHDFSDSWSDWMS